MGSKRSLEHPQLQKIKALGRQFEALRHQLADFRVLTNQKFLRERLSELESVRDELIAMDGAKLLEDGSLIIRTEVLVPFLNPMVSERMVFANQPIDLTHPETIRRVALSSTLDQWLFLAKRLDDQAAQDAFIRACVKELMKDFNNKRS